MSVSLRCVEASDLLLPGSLPEALAMMAEPEPPTPLAGGTDLMVQCEAGARKPPARLLSLKQLPELKGIDEADDTIRIGAGATHWQIRNHADVKVGLPGLVEAVSMVGGRQIQTMGTIGGSLANGSPAGDIAPYLLIADAVVEVASIEGTRQIPIRNFLIDYRKIDLKPNELIVAVTCKVLPEGAKEGWRKLGPRAAQAISKIMGNYRGKIVDGVIESFAVSLGSVAPTAIRLPEVEAFLVGKPLSEETIAEAERLASASVKPISDIRSTAEYRKWVAGRLVRGFLTSFTKGNEGSEGSEGCES
ncbi:MAG: xanthine dehydrogenase family protein subunit M [Verrucomicrobia bacterium]|nr:xanthine dehydrogenase family protein subunit M [Kiritimatiellia bacterium]MCP5488607.1 xanthine dehydrogenase family protein subunit M [Verrucomicrobiota bacterium]